MLGKNVAAWLGELQTADRERKLTVASSLLITSEYYFDDKKISIEERKKIIQSLEDAANEEEQEIRICVAYLIGILKTWSSQSQSILKKLLNDRYSQVQAQAVWAVGNISEKDPEFIAALLSLKNHPGREVRSRIPWTLKEMRANGDLVRTALIEYTNDKDSTARMYAFDAIAGLDPEVNSEIKSMVKSGLVDKDGAVRAAACRVVAQVPGDWSRVKRRLEKIIRKDVHGVQLDAVIALCNCWPESVNDSHIRNWLIENRSYWWAEKALAGERI